MSVSSREKKGFEHVWKCMQDMYSVLESHCELDQKRGRQRKAWMWRLVYDQLVASVKADVEAKHQVEELETKVFQGKIDPGTAADTILNQYKRLM